MVGVERHELDEADLVRGRARELGERDHLVLGEPADRDRVDLDRVGLGERRQVLESSEHLRERVAPGELEEAVALERVDRHVEAVDAGADERLGVALEQEPVGRDRQVVDGVDLGEHLPPGCGNCLRTSGSPPVRRTSWTPMSANRLDQAGDLLEGQNLGAFKPGQALGRHAVLAAEVAAVGDRHAQIADQAAVAVAEWLELHLNEA